MVGEPTTYTYCSYLWPGPCFCIPHFRLRFSCPHLSLHHCYLSYFWMLLSPSPSPSLVLFLFPSLFLENACCLCPLALLCRFCQNVPLACALVPPGGSWGRRDRTTLSTGRTQQKQKRRKQKIHKIWVAFNIQHNPCPCSFHFTFLT